MPSSGFTQTPLPAPYDHLAFSHRRRGIFDDPKVDVFVDDENAFAALHPRPIIEYAHYVSRRQKLGLGNYNNSFDIVDRRFAKIADLFPNEGVVLEVGAAEGNFLRKLRAERPALCLFAVEPDRETTESRAAIGLAGDYSDLATAAASGVSADLVCLFHVFEHIADPREFLEAVRRVLKANCPLVIEVPSLDDPLLSLYHCDAYEKFYFQRQHPFVYTGRSLSRVLEANGFSIRELRPYQRYGLENHLAWMTTGKPGGDARFDEMFSALGQQYRAAIETSGKTDTVFAVATPR